MQKKKAFKMHMTIEDITPIPKVEIIAEIDQLYTSTYSAGQIMTTVPLLVYTTSGTVISRFAP